MNEILWSINTATIYNLLYNEFVITVQFKLSVGNDMFCIEESIIKLGKA